MMAINLIPLKKMIRSQPSSDESPRTASRTRQTRAGSRATRRHEKAETTDSRRANPD